MVDLAASLIGAAGGPAVAAAYDFKAPFLWDEVVEDAVQVRSARAQAPRRMRMYWSNALHSLTAASLIAACCAGGAMHHPVPPAKGPAGLICSAWALAHHPSACAMCYAHTQGLSGWVDHGVPLMTDSREGAFQDDEEAPAVLPSATRRHVKPKHVRGMNSRTGLCRCRVPLQLNSCACLPRGKPQLWGDTPAPCPMLWCRLQICGTCGVSDTNTWRNHGGMWLCNTCGWELGAHTGAVAVASCRRVLLASSAQARHACGTGMPILQPLSRP